MPVPRPVTGGWEPQAGYLVGRRLAADPAVTAVLCGNDDLAVGVIRAMTEAGRPVPGSVSVVGFDDTPVAAFLCPSLTTVRLDFTGLGRACFALLHSRVASQATATAGPPLVPELIIRESAGPPPRPPGTSRRR